MTVQAQDSVQYYDGPINVGAVIPITDFTFIDNSHVSMKIRNVDGIWEYGVDYVVEGAGTLNRYARIQRAVKEGQTLAVYLDVPITQNISPEEGGNFPAYTNEYVLDKLTQISQMLDERVKRSLQISIDTPFSGTLPAPEPNKALKINSDGSGFVMSDYDPDLALVLTENFKNQAQQAAIESLASQQAAANSEQIASNKATISTEQANVSKSYADNAAELNQQLTNNFNDYSSSLQGDFSTYTNGLISTKEDGMTSLANASNALRTTQITNCLLEVPQRIKYTLENGILTIKAGSVVIVPYGVEDLTSQYPKGATFINDNFKVYDTQFEGGKFFVWAELVNDIVGNETWSGSGGGFIFLNLEKGNEIYFEFANQTSSGSDFSSTTPYNTRYSTTVNLIKKYINISGAWFGVLALPLLRIVFNNGYESVEQVFNGIGVIGSTFWVDKGIKGLSPNGRNTDGTLKNIVRTQANINVQLCGVGTADYTLLSNFNGGVRNSAIHYEQDTRPSVPNLHNYATWFNTQENKMYFYNNGSWTSDNVDFAVIGKYSVRDGVITSFQPKLPFRAVNYNDKPEISSWSMPSSKYIDLTLGASGTTYTAPANGYYLISKYAQASAQNIAVGKFGEIWVLDWAPIADVNLFCWVPVTKGETISITYTATGITNYFKFYYAEGEV